MATIKDIRRILLYGGIDKETYQQNKNLILENDMKNLRIYLIVAGIVFLLLGAASFLSNGFAHINFIVYFSTAISFWICYFLTRILSHKKINSFWSKQLFIYIFMAIFYIESLLITLQHNDLPAVTYIGVLLILPLLFAQSPLFVSIFQTFFVVVFCVFVKFYKIPDIASVDVWNGITFLAVSIATVIIIVPMRMKQLIQIGVIQKLSETDLLTGIKNRNSFEINCKNINLLDRRPICIYADANGLHELNNLKGHEAGDNMLKTIAATLKNSFNEDNVYRIGGDEFCAFAFDATLEECQSKISEIEKILNASDYHVSIGVTSPEKQDEDIENIIKRAETNMYVSKKNYYSNSVFDRRSN